MSVLHPDHIDLVDPRTAGVVGRIEVSPPGEVAGRVAAARVAGAAWAREPLAVRKKAVVALKRAFLARAREAADLLVAEIGKPAGEAWTSEILTAGELFDHWLAVIDDELAPVPVSLSPLNYPFKAVEVRPEPLGVIGLIMPWNYPIHLPLRTIVPAVLAGNAVVFKPSEHAPRCGAWLASVLESVLPADVVVTVQGGPAHGEAIVDADVDKVVFTGSVRGGQAVAARAGARMIPCALELGSKDPAIVLRDAALDRAAAGIAWGAFHNAGQDCASVERCYVHRSVYDAFVEKVVRIAGSLRPDDDLGPLVNADALAKVHAHVEEARERGARVLVGGQPLGRGYHYPATVLVDVTSDMRVVAEESFGPLLPILPFDDEDEAVAMANDTPYGLCASVWSRDVARAEKLVARVRCGVAYVNNCCFTGPMGGASWGGRGRSGHGVTGSRWGLDALVQPRTVCVDRSPQAREMWWYPYNNALVDMARGLVELGRGGGQKLTGVRLAARGLVGRWK